MIDTCTRWSQAVTVEDPSSETLLEGVKTMWCRPYGNPKIIETDQESGLTSIAAKTWFSEQEIQVVERAKHSHPYLVERHHRVLREIYCKIKQQLDIEGIACTQQDILDAALHAKNCLTTFHGVTPQEAVFGVRSTLLPDLSGGDASLEDTQGSQRLREIALEKTIQAIAEERLKRALHSKTRVSTKTMNLKVGDAVELWRQPENKEASGWRGPGTLVYIDDENGALHAE